MAVARTSTGAFNNGLAGFTAVFGAGAAAGNFGLLLTQTDNQAAIAVSNWTGESTLFAGEGTAAAAGATRCTAQYRNGITSAEITSGIAVGDSGDHQLAALLTYSGVDANNPTLNSGTAVATVATTSVDGTVGGAFFSADKVKKGDVVLAIIACDRDSATASTNTSPVWTNVTGSNSFVLNGSTTTGNGGQLIVNELLVTADATGGVNFTCSITSARWAMFLLVIKAPVPYFFNRSGLLTYVQIAADPYSAFLEDIESWVATRSFIRRNPQFTTGGGGGTTYNVTIQGQSTPAPLLVRGNAKPLSTTSTPVPTLTRSTAKGLSTTSTPAPALVRSTTKPLATTTTPVPTLVRSTGKPSATTSTPVPTLRRAFNKPLSTTSTPVPTLTRQNSKPLQTTSAPVPKVVRAYGKGLQTTSTPVSTLGRSVAKQLQGSSTPVPTLVRRTSKGLQTTSTPVPTLVKGLAYLKTLLTTTTPVPTLTRATAKPLNTAATLVSTLARVVGKVLSGLAAPTPTLIRSTNKGLQTNTTPGPSLAKGSAYAKTLLTATAPIPTVGKMTAKVLQAVSTPVVTITYAGGALGHVKAWVGSGFSAKPVKVWDGVAWVTKPLKWWTGTAWQKTGY